jgi:class 3 adenylate cyclase
MGLALLRARYLDGPVCQLAVWDGGRAHGEAGTTLDIETWRRQGHPVTVVAPIPAGEPAAPSPATPSRSRGARRVVRSILFADARGFSALTDEQLPRFAHFVLDAIAATLDDFGPLVLHRNSWGDAVYAVLEDPLSGARCALALQAAMAGLDLAACGLPEHLALRLGAHIGPVFPVNDPVTGVLAFMGSHVSRTARIEPVTPAGEVYVTEPYAAVLELLLPHNLRCDYVGHMPAAKEFGRMRMYRLYETATNKTIAKL